MVKNILTVTINIGAATTYITVKADIPEPLFHILKTSAGVYKHQVAAFACLSDCIYGRVREGTINLRSKGSVNIKKGDFPLHKYLAEISVIMKKII
jgi:hypothetical protein